MKKVISVPGKVVNFRSARRLFFRNPDVAAASYGLHVHGGGGYLLC